MKGKTVICAVAAALCAFGSAAAAIAQVPDGARTDGGPAANPPVATNVPANPFRPGPGGFSFDRPAPLPSGVKAERNIAYVENGHPNQVLDLFLPGQPSGKPLPLMIWIHGGAWMGGSQANPPVLYLVPKGFAVPSIQLSGRRRLMTARLPSASSAPTQPNTTSIPITSGWAEIPPADISPLLSARAVM
jgi:hypothetical protein